MQGGIASRLRSWELLSQSSFLSFHQSQSGSHLTTNPADRPIQRCTLEFKRDRFNGIIVDAASLPDDPQALRGSVDALVALIKHDRLALAWVTPLLERHRRHHQQRNHTR
jgi:hypothetical protein